MVKISHYEVYTDRGDGWKLEARFSAEQRHEAINLSKEKEQDKLKVKIIRETFDVTDNSYQETVEYVSGLSNRSKGKSGTGTTASSSDINSAGISGRDENAAGQTTGPSIAGAIIKLVMIIVLSLLLSNILVTLVTPLVEDFIPEEKQHLALFVIFFVMFLGLAVPLIMKKVPWYIFNYHAAHTGRVRDKSLYTRAENILRLYHLNDEYETSIAPAYPEAKAEYKRYIVDFLHNILSHLDSKSMFQDSFSRLGVKLVVYGGCLELSKYSGLRISEANSLLYEAFKILDGGDVDLEAFYDSKKTFGDNRMAVLLTGIGAYLMGQVIAERPMSSDLLIQGFNKWENQLENFNYTAEEKAESSNSVDTECRCLVNVQCLLKFFDEDMPDLDTQKQKYRTDIHNIIYNLLEKYRGKNVIERDGITSIEYDNTEDALLFAGEFIKDVSVYKDDLNDENLIFLSKCNIVEKIEDEDGDIEAYIEDILEHTYNNEIMITEQVLGCISRDKYDFEFLGDKRLNKTDKLVALYKLVY